jgi:hypothetical protein
MAKAHTDWPWSSRSPEKIDLLTQDYRILETLDSGLAKEVAKTFPNLICLVALPDIVGEMRKAETESS